ncbi:hypothetical protein [Streptomyces kurssanovii]|uniref:hypothetical protein n=1 Tax=Streptomyces kurssanovii TaxID=67312 RepID=UPI003F4E0BE6
MDPPLECARAWLLSPQSAVDPSSGVPETYVTLRERGPVRSTLDADAAPFFAAGRLRHQDDLADHGAGFCQPHRCADLGERDAGGDLRGECAFGEQLEDLGQVAAQRGAEGVEPAPAGPDVVEVGALAVGQRVPAFSTSPTELPCAFTAGAENTHAGNGGPQPVSDQSLHRGALTMGA